MLLPPFLFLAFPSSWAAHLQCVPSAFCVLCAAAGSAPPVTNAAALWAQISGRAFSFPAAHPSIALGSSKPSGCCLYKQCCTMSAVLERVPWHRASAAFPLCNTLLSMVSCDVGEPAQGCGQSGLENIPIQANEDQQYLLPLCSVLF